MSFEAIALREKTGQTISGNGPITAVLVHGIPASWHDWDLLMPKLVEAGYHPSALDLLGHGDSYKPSDPDSYSADAAYEFLQKWLNSLELRTPLVLVGHSFGGHLSIRYALNNPQKVQSLILINPLLSFDQMSIFFRFLLARPALTAAVLDLSPLVLVRLFVWIGSLKIGKSGIRSALSHEELIKMALDYKRSSSNVVYYPRSVSEKLVNYHDVNVPTLLIWGKEDPVLSVAWFKKLCRELPKVTFREISAGHYPHRSNSDEVNEIILEFLKSIST